jgi:hypothetical protein
MSAAEKIAQVKELKKTLGVSAACRKVDLAPWIFYQAVKPKRAKKAQLARRNEQRRAKKKAAKRITGVKNVAKIAAFYGEPAEIVALVSRLL